MQKSTWFRPATAGRSGNQFTNEKDAIERYGKNRVGKDISMAEHRVVFIKHDDGIYSIFDTGSNRTNKRSLDSLLHELIEEAKLDNHFMKPLFRPMDLWTMPEKRCVGCVIASLNSNILSYLRGEKPNWEAWNSAPHNYMFSKSGKRYSYQNSEYGQSPALERFDFLMISFMKDVCAMIRVSIETNKPVSALSIKVSPELHKTQAEMLYMMNDGVRERLYPMEYVSMSSGDCGQFRNRRFM